MSEDDPIFREAQDYVARAATIAGAPELEPSDHWKQVLIRFHQRAFATCRSADDLISFATENNGFVIYRLNSHPAHAQIIDRYLAWLDRNGCPLESLPTEICETDKVSAKVLTERRGRRVSTSFLWHLCIATRLRQRLPAAPRSVVEIGPGFGGLSVILKRFWPETSFTLLDLPQSLAFAHAYLRRVMPDARTRLVAAPTEVSADAAATDFTLMPAGCIDWLAGRRFDLALNVASFGEMTQPTVDYYMNFFEQKADIGWFYGINQFGLQANNPAVRGGRMVGGGICHTSMPLDPHWRARLWDLHGEDGFAQTDPSMAPCVELLMERVPLPDRDPIRNLDEARRLLVAAATPPQVYSRACRNVWEAHQLAPDDPAVTATWRTFGNALGWPEASA